MTPPDAAPRAPWGWRTLVFDPRFRVLLVLGLASGIPFDLRGQTLQLRLAEAKVDITTIGVFSLLTLPYTLKFLWAPLLDRFTPPGLARFGRRRGWQMVALAGACLGLVAMSQADPHGDLVLLGAAGLTVAFFSATYDIVVDAYRTDVLGPGERAFGAGLASGAYRGGMLLGGLATPWVAAFSDWTTAYLVMGTFLVPAALVAAFAPREPAHILPPKTLADAIVKPLVNLFERPHALAFLALIFLYKLGDAFGSNLFSAFLYDGVGFSSVEIATTRKIVGSTGIIVGTIAGGLVVLRYGLWRALVVFGVLQALTNLVFVAQAEAGRDFTLLFVAVGAENLAGGLGAAAYVTFLTALCDPRYSASQFALLASVAMLGSALIGLVAGPTAKALGWDGYFLVSTLVALPGLVLLLRLREPIGALDGPRPGRQEVSG